MRATVLIALRELSETFESRAAALRLLAIVLVLPLVTLTFFIRPAVERAAEDPGRLAVLARVFLLQFGFVPMMMAVQGLAASFALEFEAGTLVPLLAAPVATLAIFWGKLTAALVTGVSMGWLSQGAFALFFRPVTGVSWPLGIEQVVLAGGFIVFAGLPLFAIAILLASRTRRVRVAQSSTSLVLLPFFVAVLFLGYRAASPAVIVLATVGTAWLAIAVFLIALAARMWNREELLSRP